MKRHIEDTGYLVRGPMGAIAVVSEPSIPYPESCMWEYDRELRGRKVRIVLEEVR